MDLTFEAAIFTLLVKQAGTNGGCDDIKTMKHIYLIFGLWKEMPGNTTIKILIHEYQKHERHEKSQYSALSLILKITDSGVS